MSKGAGHLQSEIDSILKDNPYSSFTIEELCERIYGCPVEGRHRAAILKASKTAPQRNRAIVRWKANNPGRKIIFVNHESVMSYATARLKIYGARPDDDSQARLKLRKGERYHELTVPGGLWWLEVQRWIAERDNDKTTLEKLKPMIVAQNRRVAATIAALIRS